MPGHQAGHGGWHSAVPPGSKDQRRGQGLRASTLVACMPQVQTQLTFSLSIQLCNGFSLLREPAGCLGVSVAHVLQLGCGATCVWAAETFDA